MKEILIELSKFNSVNYLWSEFIEEFGFDKAKKIISQAIDLQKMNGKRNITMPLIFTGTGGLALISVQLIQSKTSLKDIKGNQIIIFNSKKKIFQLLDEP